MFKHAFHLLKSKYYLLLTTVLTLPALAALPEPPASDIADGTNDWIDVGGNMTYKTLSYALIALGAMIVAGSAFGIFKAYHTAQEKQDLGHFFKHLAVALAAAAVGAGLLWGGYSIIPHD